MTYDAPLMTRRADYYLRLGMALTPIKYGDKLPAFGKGWNKRENLLTTREQAATTFARPYNIGVHLGASGLVSFDADDLTLARADFTARGLDFDAFMAAHPHPIQGRGRRLWFRAPEGCPVTSRRFHSVDGVTAYEIRGGDGFQDVAPGSLHPDGFLYTWATTPPRTRADLPELPPFLADLYEALGHRPEKASKPAAARPLPQYAGESVIDRYNAHYTPEEVLERNGYRRRGDRWLSPNSKTRLAGVTLYSDGGKTRAVSHHTSDEWADQHGHDAFDLFVTLEHDGHFTRALEAARELLGMARPEKTLPAATPTELWGAHSSGVLEHCMALIGSATGQTRSKGKYMDILAALHESATSGNLRTANGTTRIEFGGLVNLAEAMLYRGRLYDLRAGLDYLCTLGMFTRVVSTNPHDRYAPLAVEVTADPRDLPAMRFQGTLVLQSTNWSTLRKTRPQTDECLNDTTKRSLATPLCHSASPTPLHAARHVLFWIQRGATTPAVVSVRAGMSVRTARRHFRTLQEAGLIDADGVPVTAPATAAATLRAEVESDPAYRNARLRQLDQTIRFATRGAMLARIHRAPAMHARRTRTLERALNAHTRIMDGEPVGVVLGVAA